MREKWIKVRVTEAELSDAKKLAYSLEVGLSDFIRFCALGPAHAHRIPHQAALESVAEQLARIGNNLNQSVELAHVANKRRTLSEANLRTINGHVRALRREIVPHLALLKRSVGLGDDDDRKTDPD